MTKFLRDKEYIVGKDHVQAIMALRYFKEKLGKLAVIGAGSLMEFALQDQNFRMPVGRIQFLYLEPLSFSEFLAASGNGQLRNYLAEIHLSSSFDDAVHHKLLDLLRIYLIIGGMTAVIREYLENKNFANCSRMQNSLLQTYRNDFGKYAKLSEHKYLQKVFDMTPRLVGSRIKYSNIDPESKSREIKSALNLLVLAGLLKPVYAASASDVPLGAQSNEAKFKLNFLDVGLMQNACGLQAQLSISKDLIQLNSGAVAEQFIGQEIRAYFDRYLEPRLFFWARDKRGSSAEVDYVISLDSLVLPVEVKAGKSGILKSLKIFIEEKKSPFGIRFSQEKISLYDKILTLPLYMAEQMNRLAREATN